VLPRAADLDEFFAHSCEFFESDNRQAYAKKIAKAKMELAACP